MKMNKSKRNKIAADQRARKDADLIKESVPQIDLAVEINGKRVTVTKHLDLLRDRYISHLQNQLVVGDQRIRELVFEFLTLRRCDVVVGDVVYINLAYKG